MLLIGSAATKYHFPFFRKPKDYDFIASKSEAYDFLSNYKNEDISTTNTKIIAKVELDVPTIFEFELIEYYISSNRIYLLSNNTFFKDSKLNAVYKVASPEILFLLKKSHICFNIHWKKNISDYLFLKDRINSSISENQEWQDIYNLRFEETKNRIKYKERSFDVSNSDFFKVSEKMVNRLLPHDNIHYATCFYDKPLFMSVKDDLNKAEMNPDKVNVLSHELKIKLIQEECMALAIERYILPCVKSKKAFNARQAYVDTAARMVYNYLPMFLRLFAVDNFMEIIDLKINYVDKFFKNVKGLDLSIEKI